MYDLTAFQRDVLYCIATDEKPHGLGVKQTLESYREIDINHGRLYSNLDTLVEKGYVTKGRINDRKNSYGSTAEGEALLVERQEWEADRLPETPTR
ncbi:PadR family transcriptional regulator [Halonotius sp. GCM10025705]|uniref:PadR family transcriptional regulator n=1 Tax=Halonotius sp. GCM10025705 TaxID=3252678 RepID=UPI00360C83CA